MTSELKLNLLKEAKERIERDLAITQAKKNAISTANSIHDDLIRKIFERYEKNNDSDIVIYQHLFTPIEARKEGYKCDETLLEWVESHPEEHYYFYLQWGEYFVLIDYDELVKLFNDDASGMVLEHAMQTIDGGTYFIVKVTRQAIDDAIAGIANRIPPQKK